MGGRGRREVEPTEEWELLLPLFESPEQQAYEEIRPVVLFGGSVAGRSPSPFPTWFPKSCAAYLTAL